MRLDRIKSGLPAYAKDLRLNLESVLGEGGAPGLSQKQIALVALASAVARATRRWPQRFRASPRNMPTRRSSMARAPPPR